MLSLPSFPHDQDCWSRIDTTPSLSSSLIADLLYAIVSQGTTSLPHAIWGDVQRPQFMLKADVHGGISEFRILESPLYQRDTCRASRTSHWTTTQRAVISAAITFHKHVSASEMVSSECPPQISSAISLAGRRRVLSAYQYLRLCTTDRPTCISFASSLSINHLLWPPTYLPNLPAGDTRVMPLTENRSTICLDFAKSSPLLSASYL
jgi:hypothetical protein